MYKEYLRKWLEENHEERESPLSYEEWEKKIYFSGDPSNEEWVELQATYDRLTAISQEVEAIRKKLYVNRAHRQLNNDWEELDGVLYQIQSRIWADGEDSFGSVTLSDYCF